MSDNEQNVSDNEVNGEKVEKQASVFSDEQMQLEVFKLIYLKIF